MKQTIANRDQFDYWNDHAGRTWAELQATLDRQIAPLGLAAMAALGAEPAERVLDVGCGCGDTSVELARRVAEGGAVVGLDLSAPMLAVARGRGADVENLEFLQADAQTARFNVPFDAAFSRFGVMFFAEPEAAFSNIASCLRPGGRLAFVCWRTAAENIWMSVPLHAALGHLPAPPPDDPEAPGPFAFARAERVGKILGAAGFTDVRIEPFDTKVGGFDLQTAVQLALRVGPLGKLLREAPSQAQNVTKAVQTALAAYVVEDKVRMDAACWIVSGKRI